MFRKLPTTINGWWCCPECRPYFAYWFHQKMDFSNKDGLATHEQQQLVDAILPRNKAGRIEMGKPCLAPWGKKSKKTKQQKYSVFVPLDIVIPQSRDFSASKVKLRGLWLVANKAAASSFALSVLKVLDGDVVPDEYNDEAERSVGEFILKKRTVDTPVLVKAALERCVWGASVSGIPLEVAQCVEERLVGVLEDRENEKMALEHKCDAKKLAEKERGKLKTQSERRFCAKRCEKR